MIEVVIDEVVLKHTAIVTLALFLKFQATNLLLGATRIKSGCRPPEDVALFPKAGPQDFHGESKQKSASDGGGDKRAKILKAKERENRVARLVTNDLENIPLGLIVAWANVLCGGGDGVVRIVSLTALWSFCLGRHMHTYAYLNALQPWRGIGYGLGLLATLVMACNACLAVAYL